MKTFFLTLAALLFITVANAQTSKEGKQKPDELSEVKSTKVLIEEEDSDTDWYSMDGYASEPDCSFPGAPIEAEMMLSPIRGRGKITVAENPALYYSRQSR